MTVKAFRRQHVFLEAVAGWLGQRLRPRVALRLPTAAVRPDSEEGTDRNWVKRPAVHVVVDWDGRAPGDQGLLFIEICEASAAVCRHLAGALEQTAQSSVAHAQTEAMEMIQEGPGGVRTVPLPISFDSARAGFERSAPRLGEHNVEVLGS